MESYRPSYNDQRDSRDNRGGARRSPPRRSPPSGMYQFGGGGDSYRPGGRNDRDAPRHGDHRSDFTFRAGDQSRHFPSTDSQRPPRDRARRPQARDTRRPRQQNQPGRGPWRPPPPHERAILRSTREKTPEQLEGMGDGKAKFISLSDISNSEGEMDLESDDDASDSERPPAKRAKPTTDDSADDGNARPRWSNPDPYTSLPPPDETHTKRRDFVKLIRKAKVAGEDQTASANPVAKNDDFISLNFDDDEDQQKNDHESDDNDRHNARRSGGNSFSHLDNLHPDRRTVPAEGPTKPVVNAASLGPPPGLAGLPPKPPTNILDTWPPPPPPQAPTGPKTLKRARQDDDDDELESLPPLPPKGKKRKREVIDGSVIDDWRPRHGSPPTPWCQEDHSSTESMGFWLHKEIADFYDFVKPHAFEDAIRHDLVKRIERTVTRQKGFAGSIVECFGSFAAGLYLPTADMDLVVLSSHFRNTGQGIVNKKTLYRVSDILEREGISQPGATEVVASARVPIIKIVDRTTGLKVDISFENSTGIAANKTFRGWKQAYPAMPVIATLVKQFLAMRGLNEVFTGGLGGFSVICMVVSLLQNWPGRQSNNFVPEEHYGDVLLNFFDLFGNKFNIATTRIRLNPHQFEPKGPRDLNGKPARPDRLSIVDPNTPTNDISSGSHNVVLVQKCFRDAFDKLQRRMAELNALDIGQRRHASILEVLFAGDYSSFDWQRKRLRKIYDSDR
ncbi:PAP/25A-associated [Lasiodiplodia theobromae]|uniref:polynucleotide adenylyltransferase n=1 Tax=Lasiodiplodia theobromae TaxID=45133 RepID=A0A5N5DH56_9PEZI|nr:Topoisomerase family protein [Lasiodiplodia theobromae]KAB2577179.1 Poly(A) RNA polymerase protein 1 [Lasiodiplodia theobromae]KAF4543719.1 Topoisomerase family protein [Lasiodiplodia theobromae]KAF9631459.1 PAP/25A-associated [Lasiodiplodia theobromae]